jgi:uncharacterized protein
VVITGRERGTFHARVEMRHRERAIEVDCRPSDGVALAVRLRSPIVVVDELEALLAAA